MVMCLRSDNVFCTPYSWRFSSELCKFLRQTHGPYARSSFTTDPPTDTPGEISVDELDRDPNARSRFVFYSKDACNTSKERGAILPDPQRVIPKSSMTVPVGELENECRIAGSTAIFLNLIHEGEGF